MCWLLAQAKPDRSGAVRLAWWLWVVLLVLGVLLILTIAAIGNRRRRLARAARDRTPSKPIKDAWAEAGKRVEPIAADADGDES